MQGHLFLKFLLWRIVFGFICPALRVSDIGVCKAIKIISREAVFYVWRTFRILIYMSPF